MIYHRLQCSTHLKIISFLVLICFSSSLNVYPQSAAGRQTPTEAFESPALRLFEKLDIPQKFGKVTDRFVPRDRPSPKSVIFIPDAHGHYEYQMRTKDILRYLAFNQAMEIIFAEGALFKLDSRYLNFFGKRKLNLELADHLARAGIVGGHEYFLLQNSIASAHATEPPLGIKVHPGKIGIYGIENAKTYKTNLEFFRKVIRNQKQTGRRLDEIKLDIFSAASRTLSRKLYRYFRTWAECHENADAIESCLGLLSRHAKRELNLNFTAGGDPPEWPQMANYFRLKEIENTIQLSEAEKERDKLLAWLEQNNLSGSFQPGLSHMGARDGRQDNPPFESPRIFLGKFYEEASSQGFSFQEYREFSKVMAASLLASEVDLAALMAESQRLSKTLFDALSKNKEEKNLLLLYEDYLVLKKTLALELNRDEYDRLGGRHERLRPSIVVKRLNKFSLRKYGQRWMRSERNSRDFGMLDKTYDQARGFYRTALRREKIFAAKILHKMNLSRKSKAVVIAGGFHGAGLKEQLRKSGIPYAEITPRVSAVEGMTNYTALMMGDARLPVRPSLLMKPSLLDGGIGALRRHLGEGTAGYYFNHLMRGIRTAVQTEVLHLKRDAAKRKEEMYHEIASSPAALANHLRVEGQRIFYDRSEIRSGSLPLYPKWNGQKLESQVQVIQSLKADGDAFQGLVQDPNTPSSGYWYLAAKVVDVPLAGLHLLSVDQYFRRAGNVAEPARLQISIWEWSVQNFDQESLRRHKLELPTDAFYENGKNGIPSKSLDVIRAMEKGLRDRHRPYSYKEILKKGRDATLKSEQEKTPAKKKNSARSEHRLTEEEKEAIKTDVKTAVTRVLDKMSQMPLAAVGLRDALRLLETNDFRQAKSSLKYSRNYLLTQKIRNRGSDEIAILETAMRLMKQLAEESEETEPDPVPAPVIAPATVPPRSVMADLPVAQIQDHVERNPISRRRFLIAGGVFLGFGVGFGVVFYGFKGWFQRKQRPFMGTSTEPVSDALLKIIPRFEAGGLIDYRHDPLKPSLSLRSSKGWIWAYIDPSDIRKLQITFWVRTRQEASFWLELKDGKDQPLVGRTNQWGLPKVKLTFPNTQGKLAAVTFDLTNELIPEHPGMAEIMAISDPEGQIEIEGIRFFAEQNRSETRSEIQAHFRGARAFERAFQDRAGLPVQRVLWAGRTIGHSIEMGIPGKARLSYAGILSVLRKKNREGGTAEELLKQIDRILERIDLALEDTRLLDIEDMSDDKELLGIAIEMLFSNADEIVQPGNNRVFDGIREGIIRYFEAARSESRAAHGLEVRSMDVLPRSWERPAREDDGRGSLGSLSIQPAPEAAKHAGENKMFQARNRDIRGLLFEALGLAAAREDLRPPLSPAAENLLKALRQSHGGIAPFVNITKPLPRAAAYRLFESADLIVGENDLGEEGESLNHVVFILGDETAKKVLARQWVNFSKERYAENPEEGSRVSKNIRFVTREKLFLAPSHLESAWVEWINPGKASHVDKSARVGGIIHPNITANGRLIKSFESRDGYGMSLLQAASLLLLGPQESGLRKSRWGPYVQENDSVLSLMAPLYSDLLSHRKVQMAA